MHDAIDYVSEALWEMQWPEDRETNVIEILGLEMRHFSIDGWFVV